LNAIAGANRAQSLLKLKCLPTGVDRAFRPVNFGSKNSGEQPVKRPLALYTLPALAIPQTFLMRADRVIE